MINKIRRVKRLLSFFYVQRWTGFEVSEKPWMDSDTLEWFEKHLSLAQMYMEFGSGGSTVLASRSKIPTISVEGDRYFARAVRKQLTPEHRTTLLDANIGLTGEWGVPVPGTANDKRVSRWKTYIDAPFQFLEKEGFQFPQLILVDGRFRRACALQTAIKARQHEASTVLLFDDYYLPSREHYHDIERLLGEPEKCGRSAIFRIPPGNPVQQSDVDQAISDYR